MVEARGLTGVGQQVGRQQAWQSRVQQPGAFLDPCTRAALGRTARARAGGEDTENGAQLPGHEQNAGAEQTPNTLTLNSSLLTNFVMKTVTVR